MSKSQLVGVADDLTDLIRQTVMLAGGTAERVYVPLTPLEELEVLRVQVTPRQEKVIREARSMWFHDFIIDIGVQQRARTVEESDTLTALVDAIVTLLEETPQVATAQAGLVTLKTIGPDPNDLNEKSTFTMVITATFRGGKKV